MAAVPQLQVYPGITDLLFDLHAVGQTLSIVTKSPDMVPKAFVKQHGWPIDIVIGFHAVKARKPAPDGLLLAMQRAGAAPADTFHVGDQPEDTQAARSAGVYALGSSWGLKDDAALRASEPDAIFKTVDELRAHFASILK